MEQGLTAIDKSLIKHVCILWRGQYIKLAPCLVGVKKPMPPESGIYDVPEGWGRGENDA